MAQPQAISNTNKWDTRTLVVMALMTAISVLLSFVEFPLIPGVAFLKFDASIMCAMVVGFAYGAGAGSVVGIVAALIHGMIMGDWVGAFMNILVTLALVVPPSAIYARKHTFKGAVFGLIVAVVIEVIVAIVANLAIDPFYYGMPFEAVAEMVIPAFLPFNLAKSVINAVLTVVVYKAISNLITPKKDQVTGR